VAVMALLSGKGLGIVFEIRSPVCAARRSNQQRLARWTRLNHDYQFTPTILNSFRVGYTREPQQWFRTTSDQGYLQKTGLTVDAAAFLETTGRQDLNTFFCECDKRRSHRRYRDLHQSGRASAQC
jgi:hypothetical protein